MYKMKAKEYMKKKRGFTLLEVLLSLCLVVVLLAGLLSYTQRTQQRNLALLAKTQINVLLTAAVQYNSIYLQWPTTLGALTPFLGTNPTQTPSFCSPWKSSDGCATYTIAHNTNYFALKVMTTGFSSAQDLVGALQNAYIDTDGKTVIAYVTAFSKPHRPRPLGVMYGSNQFGGSNCDTSTPGTRSSGPYGLLNIADNTSIPVHACTGNMNSSIGYNPTLFSCPPTSQPTMLLIPAGVPPNSSISDGFLYGDYRYVANSSTNMGPYMELHVNTYTYPSFGNNVPFLDIICLQPSNIQLWPNPAYPYSFPVS